MIGLLSAVICASAVLYCNQFENRTLRVGCVPLWPPVTFWVLRAATRARTLPTQNSTFHADLSITYPLPIQHYGHQRHNFFNRHFDEGGVADGGLHFHGEVPC